MLEGQKRYTYRAEQRDGTRTEFCVQAKERQADADARLYATMFVDATARVKRLAVQVAQ